MTSPPNPFRPIRCKPIQVTGHARQRAVQRLGLSKGEAPSRLRELFHASIKLPDRHARRLLYNSLRHVRRFKHNARYRVCGRVLLICHGNTIVTTWPLDPHQEATIFWWAITGQWVSA